MAESEFRSGRKQLIGKLNLNGLASSLVGSSFGVLVNINPSKEKDRVPWKLTCPTWIVVLDPILKGVWTSGLAFIAASITRLVSEVVKETLLPGVSTFLADFLMDVLVFFPTPPLFLPCCLFKANREDSSFCLTTAVGRERFFVLIGCSSSSPSSSSSSSSLSPSS